MAALLLVAFPVAAQTPVTMAAPTVIVPNDLNIAVISVLTANQPVTNAGYYAITDYTLNGGVYVVSIMALGPEVDPNAYTIDQTLWLGTVAIQESTWTGAIEGTPEYINLTDDVFFRPLPTAMPGFGTSAEGGEDGEDYFGPLLPITPGAQVIYGVRGIHEAGYGTTNWRAIDLVSGTDYGGNYANADVYGSYQEQVTYVCRDTNGVTVKTNTRIYGHLKENSSLQVGLQIYRGVKFATMIPGTFSGTCGWGQQQPNHFHIHYGVAISGDNTIDFGSRFTANLTLSTSEITFNLTDTYNPGDTILNITTNEIDTGGDPNTQFTGESFWDSIVGSIIGFINQKILSRYPQGQEWEAGATYVSATGAILKVVFILMSSNFKLEIFAFVVILILILEPVRTIFRIWKIIRKVIPGL